MAERVFSFPSHLAGLALAGEFEAGDQRGSFPPLTLSASLAAMMSVSLGCRRSATEWAPRVKSSVSHFWRQELQDHGGLLWGAGGKGIPRPSPCPGGFWCPWPCWLPSPRPLSSALRDISLCVAPCPVFMGTSVVLDSGPALLRCDLILTRDVSTDPTPNHIAFEVPW